MQIRSVHPFPARMAPELVLHSLKLLPPGSTVLDPMAGSGTVLRQALAMGHHAIGFDMDPLAVLMSRVWTTPVQDGVIESEFSLLMKIARSIDLRRHKLPWQQDAETQKFISYWFGETQRKDLTRLAVALLHRREATHLSAQQLAAINVLSVAFSRIIVTKEQSASLARDTSHSRPHRVTTNSDYDVFEGFERSVSQTRKRLVDAPAPSLAKVERGDARKLCLVEDSIDAVVTSPPYLNAIDYLRGHRMSLVWLGHSIPELRDIRSSAIGAERSPDQSSNIEINRVEHSMCDFGSLESRFRGMIQRYAQDLCKMTAQVARVLKPGGHATYVVGNSCLRGVFIRNSDGVIKAAELAGMKLIALNERELPSSSRYLPVTIVGSLSKRMRTESVITFQRQ